ncbi:hypothetical protein [Chryseobacterium culicis]|uniref:Uncharacterized protein n=1 Tax=Chryseobacterium culicis TaxID=680127 RepID=A0A1H6H8Q2_CHRCI|nr:hypothetical protein [Chryseobacterium culicis]SEH31522.1 hypothetical protein SAMN05421593_1471 [Chryseobacterium culicis]
MKALKIYSIFSTIAIIVLSIGLNQTNKDYIKAKKEFRETEEVLKQCSERYYEEIGK